MSFDAFTLRNRPDQTAQYLNEMLARLDTMQNTIRILSKDRKSVIIIGEQPVNPSTGEPYSFGIHTYQILGDRLAEV